MDHADQSLPLTLDERAKPAYIYLLICPVTREPRYLGKTIAPKARLSNHLRDAKRHNYSLARWLRKLQESELSPTLKVIYQVKEGEDWMKVETQFIKEYRLKFDLLNEQSGGQGNLPGFKPKRSSVDKIRRANSIAVSCYCAETGEFLRNYDSACEASRRLSLFSNKITAVCKKRLAHTGGYIFRYHTCDHPNRVAPAKQRGTPVIQIDQGGKTIRRWNNAHIAAAQLQLTHTAILSVCEGRKKTHGGFSWKYA